MNCSIKVPSGVLNFDNLVQKHVSMIKMDVFIYHDECMIFNLACDIYIWIHVPIDHNGQSVMYCQTNLGMIAMDDNL